MGFFPTYMALLGPTRLFIFGKSCLLHGFLLSKYRKIPTYMPLLEPTRLLISKKTSHLHCTVIRALRLLGTPEYSSSTAFERKTI